MSVPIPMEIRCAHAAAEEIERAAREGGELTRMSLCIAVREATGFSWAYIAPAIEEYCAKNGLVLAKGTAHDERSNIERMVALRWAD